MADLEFENINRGNQPTQDGAGTDDAWTFTGKINRNFAKLLSFLPSKFGTAASRDVGREAGKIMEVGSGYRYFMWDYSEGMNYVEKVIILGEDIDGGFSMGSIYAVRT